MPRVFPRSSWAEGRLARGPLREEEVRFLVVHHSASHNGHSSSDVASILRGFYDFHTGERGWDDIAYNFLIDGEGGIWEGRTGSIEGPVAGDATGGNQGFSQLVCLIGDFDQAEPSAAALDSLVGLTAWLADRYSIPTGTGSVVSFVSRGSNLHPAGAEVTTPTITGHRTMSRTSCPGRSLDAFVVSGILGEVESLRVAVDATTTAPAPSTADTSTTTSASASSTTLASPTTLTSPSRGPATTPPVASADPGVGPSTWSAGLVGAVLAAGGGLVAWRRKRMSGGRHRR